MSPSSTQTATKADIEDLRQHLFGTWKAIGHVLAAIYGSDEARRLIATANASARADEHAAVYQLVDVALEYIAKGAEASASRGKH